METNCMGRPPDKGAWGGEEINGLNGFRGEGKRGETTVELQREGSEGKGKGGQEQIRKGREWGSGK